MSDFDYRQLDEVIHSRIRLALLSVLAVVDEAEFTFLRDQVRGTDGNTGAHLTRLEEAGYISVRKEFVSRKPVTRYALTDSGRAAFAAYLDRLARLLPKNDDMPS